MKKSKILRAVAIICIITIVINFIQMRTLQTEFANNSLITRTVQFGKISEQSKKFSILALTKQGWIDFFKTCSEKEIWYISPYSDDSYVSDTDIFNFNAFNEIEIPEEIKEYWSDARALKSISYDPYSDGYENGLSLISYKQNSYGNGIAVRIHGGGTAFMNFEINNVHNAKVLYFQDVSGAFREYIIFVYNPTGQLIAMGSDLQLYAIT